MTTTTQTFVKARANRVINLRPGKILNHNILIFKIEIQGIRNTTTNFQGSHTSPFQFISQKICNAKQNAS